MAGKEETLRYPHSSTLFQFCKEALAAKLNYEVKVIDQHVGAMLDFDPADCSHWKQGKKNIRSIDTLSTISQQLEVDTRFLLDIISGRMDLDESVQEYIGYGGFQLSQKAKANARKDYIKNPNSVPNSGHVRDFEQALRNMFLADETLAKELTSKAQIASCPVHLAEVLETVQGVVLEEGTVSDRHLISTTVSGGVLTITTAQGATKPHMRFLIAREIASFVLYGKDTEDFAEDDLKAVRINCFAMNLLIPTHLLERVVQTISPTRDMVEQLADIFWVGRMVMSEMLKTYVLSNT